MNSSICLIAGCYQLHCQLLKFLFHSQHYSPTMILALFLSPRGECVSKHHHHHLYDGVMAEVHDGMRMIDFVHHHNQCANNSSRQVKMMRIFAPSEAINLNVQDFIDRYVCSNNDKKHLPVLLLWPCAREHSTLLMMRNNGL